MTKHEQFFIFMGFYARAKNDREVYWIKEMPGSWMLIDRKDVGEDGYLKPQAFALNTYLIRTSEDITKIKEAFEEIMNIKAVYEMTKKRKTLTPIEKEFLLEERRD